MTADITTSMLRAADDLAKIPADGVADAEDLGVGSDFARSEDTAARPAHWPTNGARVFGEARGPGRQFTGRIRVALYARYSSDLQNPMSVADQLLACKEHAATQGNWKVVGSYYDEEKSAGSQVVLPGAKALLLAAERGEFDLVLSEGLDRITRNQSLSAGIYEQLEFLGIAIVTLQEGLIDPFRIAFKGAMNASFLKDLGFKVRRGLKGRVLEGKSAGGLPYGYNLVKQYDAEGEPIRGLREINEVEAQIVRRIFREYAAGVSPKAIARGLNDDHIPGPDGGLWTDSSIRGHNGRGTGILNNELYVGKIVWNRRNVVRNPVTGKYVSRLNPPEMWVTAPAPTLRIIDQELWDAAKAQQAALAQKYEKTIAATQKGQARARALNSTHRPRSLLSGLLVCGHCGGPYALRGQGYYACSNHLQTGSCPNGRNLRRDEIEARLFAALRGTLAHREAITEAMQAFVDEIKRDSRERAANYSSNASLLTKVRGKIQEIGLALEDGYSRDLSQRLRDLEAREAELEKQVSAGPPPEIRVPTVEEFADKIGRLAEALNDPDERDEAMTIIHEMIDRIVVKPELRRGAPIALELHGDLISILERMADEGTADPECRSRWSGRPHSTETDIRWVIPM